MASFKRISPGNWSFRYKYKDKITGEQREVKRRGFQSKALAEKEYEHLKRNIQLGFDSAPNETLAEFLEYWIKEYKEGKIAKNTYRLHERNIKNHIVPYFKSIQLNDLSYKLYQQFINHLIELKYSKRTVEIIHGTMYGAMQKAKILKKIHDNPCTDVSIYSAKEKREKENKAIIKFIPYEKIEAFLEAALSDNYTYYIFFRFLIETGVRKGEALALQWSNVDLTSNRIRIVQSLDYEADSEEELFSDTKTYHSVREIPITNRLAMDLRSHKVRQNDNIFRLKQAYKNELDLVFCRENGTPLPKSTLFNAFRRILKKADLPALSIHTLRHTHAVLLLESNVEMKYIQETLGHGSMQITSDIYTHVSKKIETDAIERFENHTKNIILGAELGHKSNG
ncbi:tyrosine-type recombinase/integrase [Bacillus sp. Au-Bac7]|uniref:tyrosine-type recombinase/integrase n=1 Tax=Bacillus sp. Au-Bac7 TaxID=2906458 RepID=UPI001E2CCDD7|nr:site-specific integrase [Bacillus sp. Au-Bac7]MCE4048052.1 site-specific integrase [Bacillus sp. Au-Bac7]